MANQTTFAISHSGDINLHRTGIKTLLGAKRIAKQDIAQSFNGRITVHAELHHDNGEIERYAVAVLYGYDDKWTQVS